MSQDNMTVRPLPDDWQALLVDNLYIYAVLAISLDGTILSCNPGVTDVLGYDKDSFIGQPAHIIFTSEDRKAEIPEQEFRLARENGNANDVRWHVRADGSHFWGTGAMSALRNEAGKLTGYAKVVRDSSASKRLEESLAGLNEDLEARVTARTADIRLLAAELTLAEQKERQALAKRLHDSMQQELYGIQFALADLKRELGDHKTTNLSRAEDLLLKTMRLTRSVTTDLRPVVLDDPDVCAILAWLATSVEKKYGLSVTVRAESCRIEDNAARALLFNLTSELLFSVVKHAGVLEADVTLKIDERLELTVTDKGAGFSAGSNTSGTGLGLTGAEKRLQLFGGTLHIDSTINQGTRIMFSLPLNLLASADPE